MGRDSSFLVYFDNPAITLDDAERVLAQWRPVRTGDSLEIAIPRTGTAIAIGLSDEPHVVLEAQEIAEDPKVPALARCRRRFECLVDDLEAALDDYTVLSAVQEGLQTLTSGWVFLSWNGEICIEPGL